MVFVFDLDDTLVDTDGYSEWYINNFIKENNLPYKQIASVARFAEKKFDWDTSIALSWYKEYGDQMMEEFPLNKGAKELLDFLYNEGHTIVIATARSTDWHTNPNEVTKRWLIKNEVKYHKLYVGRIDKEKICEEEKADFFLDDDINITKRVGDYFHGFNSKGKACLFTTSYNKDLQIGDNVERVADFEEFLGKIK